MKSRGAGLVVQTELIVFLKEHGIVAEEAMSIPAYKSTYGKTAAYNGKNRLCNE